MKSYIGAVKQNRGSKVFVAALCLLLCVMLSASLLFSQLLVFVQKDPCRYIPLTKSGGKTHVSVVDGAQAAWSPNQPMLLVASPVLTANWFRTYDENTVWSGETEVEIFRLSYDNGSGDVTVQSSNGDKLLAPGTENTYTFALQNTNNTNVAFDMNMEAYLSHGENSIPVQVRVYDYEGQYFAGSADQWAEPLALNDVVDSGTLKPNHSHIYHLQWQWPFEGDDAYDTMIGNLAVDKDITLKIVINTRASYTPQEGGGVPQTGDNSQLLLISIIMVLSLAALLLLLFLRPKREEKDE